MKYLFSLFLIGVLGCQPSNNLIKIKCTLSHYAPQTFSCGIHSVWWGIKFKDQRTCKEFIGFVNCPELYDAGFFSRGKLYSVVMKPGRPDSTYGLRISGYDMEKLKEYTIEEIKADTGPGIKCDSVSNPSAASLNLNK